MSSFTKERGREREREKERKKGHPWVRTTWKNIRERESPAKLSFTNESIGDGSVAGAILSFLAEHVRLSRVGYIRGQFFLHDWRWQGNKWQNGMANAVRYDYGMSQSQGSN